MLRGGCHAGRRPNHQATLVLRKSWTDAADRIRAATNDTIYTGAGRGFNIAEADERPSNHGTQ